MSAGVWLELGGDGHVPGVALAAPRTPVGCCHVASCGFPRSDCFLSRPPSRKGQEAIEGRKLVGLSPGEPAWRTGGSATPPGSPSRPGGPFGEKVAARPPVGRRGPGWEGAGRPPIFPSRARGIPHRSPRAVGKRSGDVNKPPSTALPAELGRARPLPPASVRAGCPPGTVACQRGDGVPWGIGARSGAGCGAGMFPEGPWVSCRGYGVPAKSAWLLREKRCRVTLD